MSHRSVFFHLVLHLSLCIFNYHPYPGFPAHPTSLCIAPYIFTLETPCRCMLPILLNPVLCSHCGDAKTLYNFLSILHCCLCYYLWLLSLCSLLACLVSHVTYLPCCDETSDRVMGLQSRRLSFNYLPREFLEVHIMTLQPGFCLGSHSPALSPHNDSSIVHVSSPSPQESHVPFVSFFFETSLFFVGRISLDAPMQLFICFIGCLYLP